MRKEPCRIGRRIESTRGERRSRSEGAKGRRVATKDCAYTTPSAPPPIPSYRASHGACARGLETERQESGDGERGGDLLRRWCPGTATQGSPGERCRVGCRNFHLSTPLASHQMATNDDTLGGGWR